MQVLHHPIYWLQQLTRWLDNEKKNEKTEKKQVLQTLRLLEIKRRRRRRLKKKKKKKKKKKTKKKEKKEKKRMLAWTVSHFNQNMTNICVRSVFELCTIISKN